MKAIMMSIKPRHNKNICNHIKWWEIRKLFPLDYEGWVYIYNTKDTKHGYLTTAYVGDKLEFILSFSKHYKYYGKVIGRFWCDKVEEIKLNLATRFFTKSMNEEELLKQSCLTSKELENYLWSNICCGKAIHITKLEIFDKPKELSEFYHLGASEYHKDIEDEYGRRAKIYKDCFFGIKKAPQSWCYVEVDS